MKSLDFSKIGKNTAVILVVAETLMKYSILNLEWHLSMAHFLQHFCIAQSQLLVVTPLQIPLGISASNSGMFNPLSQ